MKPNVCVQLVSTKTDDMYDQSRVWQIITEASWWQRLVICICVNVILHLYKTKLQEPSTLTVLQVTSHSELVTSPLAGRRRAEQATANMSCSKTFFLVNSVYTMFSVLVFMCRDPGDATSKVSCCVQTSYCFKNRDLDAIVKVPIALPLKMSLIHKQILKVAHSS